MAPCRACPALLGRAPLEEDLLIASLDAQLLLAISNGLPQGVANVFLAISQLGGPIGIPCWLIGLGLIALRTLAFRRWLLCVASVASAAGLDALLKALFGRPRPWRALPGLRITGIHEMSLSFPSGHSTASFALAVAVGLAWPRWRIPALVLAALVAFSRLVVGAHYPSDVLAGAALGTVCALAFGRWQVREEAEEVPRAETL